MLGTCRACCQMTQNAKTEEGELLRFGEVDFTEIWHSDSLRALRRAFIQGEEPEACNSCWKKEESGALSTRHHFLQWAERRPDSSTEKLVSRGDRPSETPTALGLHPGNICTLSCRMCYPVKSSSIRADRIATELTDTVPVWKERRLELDAYRRKAWWADDSTVATLTDMLPDGPKRIMIAGGEPFVTPWANKFLYALSDRDDAHEITFQAFTNGVQLPKSTDALAKLGEVQLNVSIEAVGPLNDYIRHGSDWDTVSRVIDEMTAIPGVRVIASPSLQVYNMLAFEQLVDWTIERGIGLNIGMITDPYQLDVIGAPKALRQLSSDMLRRVITRLKATDGNLNTKQPIQAALGAIWRMEHADEDPERGQRYQRKFVSYTHQLDQARGQSLAQAVPDIYKAYYAQNWDASEPSQSDKEAGQTSASADALSAVLSNENRQLERLKTENTRLRLLLGDAMLKIADLKARLGEDLYE